MILFSRQILIKLNVSFDTFDVAYNCEIIEKAHYAYVS